MCCISTFFILKSEILPKHKTFAVFINGCILCFFILFGLSEKNVKVKTRLLEMDDLQIFSCSGPTHFSLFSSLNSVSVFCLSSFHPSIPWQHELPLCVTVTWASASPHITAAFDWPGLSRSVSCCLIITLFDCWSRDVIDWSAYPVWAKASEVACTCVCTWGGGCFITKASTHMYTLTSPLTYHIDANTHAACNTPTCIVVYYKIKWVPEAGRSGTLWREMVFTILPCTSACYLSKQTPATNQQVIKPH